MSDTETIPLQLEPAMDALRRGMELDKCYRCGCMAQVLTDAEVAFSQAEDEAPRAFLPAIQAYRELL